MKAHKGQIVSAGEESLIEGGNPLVKPLALGFSGPATPCGVHPVLCLSVCLSVCVCVHEQASMLVRLCVLLAHSARVRGGMILAVCVAR